MKHDINRDNLIMSNLTSKSNAKLSVAKFVCVECMLLSNTKIIFSELMRTTFLLFNALVSKWT